MRFYLTVLIAMICLVGGVNVWAQSDATGILDALSRAAGRRSGQTNSWHPDEINKIKKQIQKVHDYKSNNPFRRPQNYRYAMVKNYNCETDYFDTYLINLQASTGRPEIVEKFSTGVGYAGVGCGKGQTRPGIFKMRAWQGKPDKGKSLKESWGNDWKMWFLDKVDGTRGCACPDCVFHSQKNLEDPPKKQAKALKSAGCTTVSEDVFKKFEPNGAFNDVPGNTLVVNPTEEEFNQMKASCKK